MVKTFHAGLLIPWVNTAMEDEIPELVHPDVGLHWSRLRPQTLPLDGHDTRYLDSMMSSIPHALSEFDGLNLNCIVLGCTSVSFASACTRDGIPSEHNHQPIFSAFDAILHGIEKGKVRSLIVFAPYDVETLEGEVALLRSYGVEVIRGVALDYKDEIRYISEEQICSAVAREYRLCDAVLISCTALYTIDVLRRLKRELRVNSMFLSSNTAIAELLNDLFHEHVLSQKLNPREL